MTYAPALSLTLTAAEEARERLINELCEAVETAEDYADDVAHGCDLNGAAIHAQARQDASRFSRLLAKAKPYRRPPLLAPSSKARGEDI